MSDSDWMTIAEAIKAIYVASFGTSSSATHKVADAKFFIRKFPWDTNADHPGCFLCPAPERIVQSTNATDDWGYGVQVFLTNASNRSLTNDHDRLHYLRERAIGEFLCKRIGSIPSIFVTVEPLGIIDPSAFAANFDMTTFVLRCTKRKTRPTQSS